MSDVTAAVKRPVRSMTGFARVAGRVNDQLGYTLMMKCVNHRFLDPQFRLPVGCDALEMEIRRALKQHIVRGHVEVTLQIDRSARGGVRFDLTVAKTYVEAFREAAHGLGVTGEPDLNVVLRQPGVMTAESVERTDEMDALGAVVQQVLPQAFFELNRMREREGAVLAQELGECMQRIRGAATEVRALRHGIQQIYFTVLKGRIADLTNDAGVSDERVLTEAALLAERGDVDEELVRLLAHVDHFETLLAEGGEAGKKLDFLLQEFNREANTLLAKTSGVAAANSLRITELGLLLKTEIERSREQVQNLE